MAQATHCKWTHLWTILPGGAVVQCEVPAATTLTISTPLDLNKSKHTDIQLHNNCSSIPCECVRSTGPHHTSKLAHGSTDDLDQIRAQLRSKQDFQELCESNGPVFSCNYSVASAKSELICNVLAMSPFSVNPSGPQNAWFHSSAFRAMCEMHRAGWVRDQKKIN